MRTRVRIAIGGIRYESNSFAGIAAPADCFETRVILRGDDVVYGAATNSEIRGAVATIQDDTEVQLIGLLDTFGGCGAPVPDSTYVALRDELLDRLRTADPVDGVYLSLHGAMTTTERDDAEADLLGCVRDVVGHDVPLVVSFDLHAAVSAATAELADAVVGFKTCPHTDYVETGAKAIDLVLRAARTEIAPAVVRAAVPMLTPSEAHDTTSGPLAGHVRRLQRLVAESGLLDGSIFACQPWLDTPRSSWVVTVTHDRRSSELAAAVAEEVRRGLLEDLSAFSVTKVPVGRVWEAVHGLAPSTVVVADSGDSPSAGAPGDSVDCLRSLVAPGRPPVLATITDPAAAAEAARVGAGAAVRLRLGGTLTPGLGASLEVAGTVRSVHDGRYRQQYPAAPVDIGQCAVVRVENADIVVTSRPAFMLDTSLIDHVGLRPLDYGVVQVKSAGGFRALWSAVTTASVVVDSLGASSSRLTDLPFRRLPTPLWPFTDPLAGAVT